MKKKFLVCSDCAYFQFTELIDKKYPMIKRGICKKHDKIVDNRWETKCNDNTYYYCCDQCIHFKENKWFDDAKNIYGDDYPFECSFKFIPIEEDSEPCEHFELFNN